MKKIHDHVFQQMSQQFEVITAMDFRKQPGEVLDSAALGKTFLITKSGRPVAVLSKPPGETLSIVVDSKGGITYER